MTSPLASPPLVNLGRWMARKVHGNRRSADGYLLIGKNRYADEEQEWRLGQAYLGLFGLTSLVLFFPYVWLFHQHTGHWIGRRHILGHWIDLPLDLKILIPLTVVGHIIGLVSVFRLCFVFGGIGPVEDLGE